MVLTHTNTLSILTRRSPCSLIHLHYWTTTTLLPSTHSQYLPSIVLRGRQPRSLTFRTLSVFSLCVEDVVIPRACELAKRMGSTRVSQRRKQLNFKEKGMCSAVNIRSNRSRNSRKGGLPDTENCGQQILSRSAEDEMMEETGEGEGERC